MRQLALPFLHRDRFPTEGFLVAPSNEHAHALIVGPSNGAGAAWPEGRLVVWGPAGTGKTHLLHLWLDRLRADRRDAALLDGAAVRHLAPDDQLPGAGGGLAIDDADAAVEDPEQMLHLLNRLAEDGAAALLAFRAPPARLSIPLPDLASRLRATLAVRLAAPEDALLDALFVRLLTARQLAVPPHVVRFLRDRLPRDPAALRDAARRLDLLSLEKGRAVTLPLAAGLVGHEASPLDAPASGHAQAGPAPPAADGTWTLDVVRDQSGSVSPIRVMSTTGRPSAS